MAKIEPDFIRIGRIAPAFSKWCTWKYVDRRSGKPDKPAKVPYSSASHQLKTNEPDTWLDFDRACALYNRGSFDGVGVLMSGAKNLVGIDVDDCLDSTGSVVPELSELVGCIAQWGSYIEVSPSGSGLRAFVRGVKDDGLKQKISYAGHSIEVYDDEDARYLTLTGQEWGGEGRQILKKQPELEAFLLRFGFVPGAAGAMQDESGLAWTPRSDAEVLALLGTHNKRGRVSRLLAGDMSEHGGDHSSADMALCGEIAFFTRDPDQIDRLFRQSGLIRPKWDEKRGRQTYGDKTIGEALARQGRGFDDDRARKAAGKQSSAAQAAALNSKGAELLAGGIADLLDGKGRLKRNPHTVVELLLRDRKLTGTLFYDEFRGSPQKLRPLSDALGKSAPNQIGNVVDDDLIALAAYLGKVWGLDEKPQQIKDAVSLWARALSRNPITERLDELADKWDGKPRIAGWLIAYCHADTKGGNGKDITEYVKAVGARWLIQVVARAYQPGCQADSMLVLEGKQGVRKSTAARVLCEAIDPNAFLEGFSLDGQSEQNTLMRLEGRLIVEWGELAGLTKHEAARVKQFITQREDSYRKPYARTGTTHKRTAVFLASTNEPTYLRDLTGNRRIWPVKVGLIDIARLKEDAGQLWGEAVQLYRTNARWWIAEHSGEDAELQTMTQVEQMARLIPDAWDELAIDLAEAVVDKELTVSEEVGKAKKCLRVNEGASLNDLMEAAGLEGVRTDAGGARSQRFANSLKKAGWVSYKSSGRTKWKVPEELAAQIERDRR